MNYEINLIEGERGKLHVTSDDVRTENVLMFGTGRKVLNMDNAFEASMPNSNTVRITSGVFYNNGMFIRIDRDTYMDVAIENGLPGTFRHDLICIRYTRDIQAQLESASIVVKKGMASESAVTDPSYTVGDVLEFENLDEFPLYRVCLNGVMPTLEPMFVVEDAMDNISMYRELLAHIQDDNNPHDVTKAQVGLGNADNTSDVNKPVSTAQQTAINNAKASANAYTDQKIANLINGAPSALDTLKEIADAMTENEDVVEALNASVGKKANATEVEGIKANVSTNTKDIDALAKEQDEFETQLEVLKGNMESNAEGVSGRVAGTNPTAQNTTNANWIYGKFKGYTSQGGEPTPDNPIEINGLAKDGVIEVKTCGKNIYSGNSVETFTAMKVIYIDLEADTYTLSAIVSSTDTDTSTCMIMDAFNQKILGYIQRNADRTSLTFTLDKPTNRLNLYASGNYNQSVEDTATFADIQIEKGTEATPYEPHTETTANIPTDATLYEGDYIEVYADGSGKLYRKMNEVVFDGSSDERWSEAGDTYGKYLKFIVVDSARDRYIKEVYCSHYRTNTGYWTNVPDKNCGFMVDNPRQFGIIDNSITTIDEWKTWLQSNPVTVVYELAKPKETPLTPDQVSEFKKLCTFDNTTNVFCEGEVEVLYLKNTDGGKAVATVQREKSNIANNLTTTEEGMVLDARQGKALDEKITALRKAEFITETGDKSSVNVDNVVYTQYKFLIIAIVTVRNMDNGVTTEIVDATSMVPTSLKCASISEVYNDGNNPFAGTVYGSLYWGYSVSHISKAEHGTVPSGITVRLYGIK